MADSQPRRWSPRKMTFVFVMQAIFIALMVWSFWVMSYAGAQLLMVTYGVFVLGFHIPVRWLSLGIMPGAMGYLVLLNLHPNGDYAAELAMITVFYLLLIIALALVQSASHTLRSDIH